MSSYKKSKKSYDTAPSQRKYMKKKAKKAKKAAYRVPKGPSVSANVERLTYDIGAASGLAMIAATDAPVAVSGANYLKAASDAPACLIVLNQVPQNASASGRIGRHFLMRSIHLRLLIDAADRDSVTIYLLEIRNRQPVAALPAVNAIFNHQTSGTLTRIDGASTYRMIRRWNYSMSLDTAERFQEIDALIPLNVLTSYTQADTTGTFTNMTDGALCLCVLGQRGLASEPTTVYVNSRLYYSDQ